MGEVYRARDTRLGRDVAIKVLPIVFANDPDRLRRFEQEARAVAALNHPNILSVHDIGVHDELHFIVTEFLQGKTLRQELATGALSPNRATEYAIQLTEGLAAAHEVGIVHRDLKPENLFITKSGHVKVLDFGLSKQIVLAPSAHSDGTTLVDRAQTSVGIVLGTVGYMSPEQVRGETIDHRTDIFSAGAVLYEMLTGRQAFHRNSAAETMAAILKEDPPEFPVSDGWQIPKALERVAHRCLAKDPEQRFQSAKDLGFALANLDEVPQSPRPHKRWPLYAGLATLVVCAALLTLWFSSPLPPPRILASKQITHDGLQKCCLLTDGNRIYFQESSGNRVDLVQVSATGGEVAPLNLHLSFPVLSNISDIAADGSELLGANPAPGAISTWPLPAGAPRRIGDLKGDEAAWAPDGGVIFAVGKDIYVAGRNSSSAKKIGTAPGEPGRFRFSPNGERIRFAAADRNTLTSTLMEIKADGSGMHAILPGWNNPPQECCGSWTANRRYYVFLSTRDFAQPTGLQIPPTGDVWALPEKSGIWNRRSRVPVQLTTSPLQFSDVIPSRDGKRLFVVGVQRRAELVRYEAKSDRFSPFLGGISAGDVDFSRDGQWVAYVTYPDGNLWRSRIDGTDRLQLTYAPMSAALAHWSPDGRQIAFSASSPGHRWKIFLVSRDGGTPHSATSLDQQEQDPTWSTDGTRLAFGVVGSGPDQCLVQLLDLATRQITELPGSRGFYAPRWSPDGRFIVTLSASTYDKLLLFDTRKQTKRQISFKALPGYIAWSSDSGSIYFDTMNTLDPGYFRLRVNNEKLDRIVDLGQFRSFPSQFGGLGTWTGLAPGDIPLFVRDLSSQEIYALDVELP
jgi:serine/threonine protein kinase